jgi:hypothetical protein
MGQKINANIYRLGKTRDWDLNLSTVNLKSSSPMFQKNIKLKTFLFYMFNRAGLFVHSYSIGKNFDSLDIQIKVLPISGQKINALKSRYKNIVHKKAGQFDDTLLENLRLNKNKAIINIKNNLKKPILIKKQKGHSNFGLSFTKVLRNFMKTNRLNLQIVNLSKVTQQYYYKNSKDFKNIIQLLRRYRRAKFFPDFLKLAILIYSPVSSSANLFAQLIASHLPVVRSQTTFVLFLKQYLNAIEVILEKSQLKGIRIAIKGRFGGISRSKTRVVQVGQVGLQTIGDSTVDFCTVRSYTKYGVFSIKVWISKNLK